MNACFEAISFLLRYSNWNVIGPNLSCIGASVSRKRFSRSTSRKCGVRGILSEVLLVAFQSAVRCHR